MGDPTRQQEMPRDNNGEPVQVLGLGDTNHNMTAGGAAQHTPVISDNGHAVVRVFAAANVYIKIGVNAVASTSDAIFPASGVEYFKVKKNERVSVLQVDTGGTVTVTHMD